MPSANKADTVTHKGEVIWFNESKGHGFIRPADGSQDVFVHFSGIAMKMARKNLEPQQRVEYELGQSNKGPFAFNVKVTT